jgi:rare lipoprotein A
MKNIRIISALIGLFFLSSCAETELASHLGKKISGRAQTGNFKVGNPYEVEGKTYVPQESYTLEETGIASWYGPGFDGKRTANGERFNEDELTGAHRTLQMPSLVRVTNLDNGRSLIVRINDRGPFKRGRVIDLSTKAADLLGFKHIGTAKVKLQVLKEESLNIAEAAKRGEDTSGVEVAMNERMRRGGFEPAVATPQDTATMQSASVSPVERADIYAPAVPGRAVGGHFYPNPVVKNYPVTPTSIFVQVGSFTQATNASALAAKLRTLGNAQVYPAFVNGRQFYRVRLSSPNVDQADQLLARVVMAGNPRAIIVVD